MLLRTIITNPGDDTARLVYADWLEENGEPERGEFIRVQIELARIPDPPCRESRYLEWDEARALLSWQEQHHDRRGYLSRREQELLSGLARQWWVVPPVHRGGGHYRDPFDLVVFARGFVESVTCTAAAWLEHGPAVAAGHPVTAVTLTDRVPASAPAASVAFSPRGGADASLHAWGGTAYWWWQRGGWDLYSYGLWDELFDCLPSRSGISNNRQDAVTDLSTAAALWARKRAGLPPL